MTINFFEMHNMANVAMENQVNVLLDSFSLLGKIIACVKDEGSNLYLNFYVNFHGFLLCLSINMHVLGMQCQRHPNMLLIMPKIMLGTFLTLKQLNHHYKKLLLGFKIWEGELVVERIL